MRKKIFLLALAFDRNIAGISQSWAREHVPESGSAFCSERERRDAELGGGAYCRVALLVDHCAPCSRDACLGECITGGVQGQQLPEDVGVGGR